MTLAGGVGTAIRFAAGPGQRCLSGPWAVSGGLGAGARRRALLTVSPGGLRGSPPSLPDTRPSVAAICTRRSPSRPLSPVFSWSSCAPLSLRGPKPSLPAALAAWRRLRSGSQSTLLSFPRGSSFPFPGGFFFFYFSVISFTPSAFLLSPVRRLGLSGRGKCAPGQTLGSR